MNRKIHSLCIQAEVQSEMNITLFAHIKLHVFFSQRGSVEGEGCLAGPLVSVLSCPLLSSRLFRLGASVTVMTTVNVSLSSEAAADDRAGKLACRIGFELNWPECTFHTWLTTPAPPFLLPPSACFIWSLPPPPPPGFSSGRTAKARPFTCWNWGAFYIYLPVWRGIGCCQCRAPSEENPSASRVRGGPMITVPSSLGLDACLCGGGEPHKVTPVCSECKVTLVCCICRCWWEMNRVPVVHSHPTPSPCTWEDICLTFLMQLGKWGGVCDVERRCRYAFVSEFSALSTKSRALKPST